MLLQNIKMLHFLVIPFIYIFILVICFSWISNKILLLHLFLTIHFRISSINFLLPFSYLKAAARWKKFFAWLQVVLLIFMHFSTFLSPHAQYPKRMFSLTSQFNDCKLITRVPSLFWARLRIALMMILYLSFLINLEVVCHVS